MANLTLSREMQNMAERLAENSHDIWAKKKKEEMASSGNNFFLTHIKTPVKRVEHRWRFAPSDGTIRPADRQRKAERS